MSAAWSNFQNWGKKCIGGLMVRNDTKLSTEKCYQCGLGTYAKLLTFTENF